MTAEEKLAHQRLSVLELAQALGNVSEACRQRWRSRSISSGVRGLSSLTRPAAALLLADR